MRRTCINRCPSGSSAILPLAAAPLPLFLYRRGVCRRGKRKTSTAPVRTERPTPTTCPGSIASSSLFWGGGGYEWSSKSSPLPGCLAQTSAWKSGFYVGEAQMEKLTLARGGCGAVCRALQGSAALHSVHHHHRYRLRILRNHAGPLPAQCPALSQSGRVLRA